MVGVNELEFKSDNLPQDFKGKRIVFISDMHCGLYFSVERVREVVEGVNALNPDIVLLGGDYTTRGGDSLGECIDTFSGINAPLGVYGVLGNHDNWGERENTLKFLGEAGVSVLENRGVWVQSGNSRIRVGGVSDLWTGKPDIEPVLDGVEADDFVILLSHNPQYVKEISYRGVDLVLAGHTHGGQMLPMRFLAPYLPSRLKQEYVFGWHDVGDTRLFVTNGLGTVFFPLRFMAPPEIVLLKLSR